MIFLFCLILRTPPPCSRVREFAKTGCPYGICTESPTGRLMDGSKVKFGRSGLGPRCLTYPEGTVQTVHYSTYLSRNSGVQWLTTSLVLYSTEPAQPCWW